MKRSRIARKAPKVKSATLNHQERKDAPQTPSRAKKPALRKSKLSAVSNKRAKWLEEYRKAKHEMGPGPHPCAVCGKTITFGVDGDPHHRSGRRTLADLLDFIPVCRHCHERIHASPSWSMEKGYLTPRYRR